MGLKFRLALAILLLGLSSCGQASIAEGDVCPEPELRSLQEPLSTIDCSTSTDTGYTDGKAFTITVVSVDGKQVELETANAYYVMAKAASADGVEIRIVSGFRTMTSQEYLYACYVNCNCNSCNLAAKPGYSNHQSGHALDLNTSAAGVLDWLNAHGAAYGFKRTVPSEAWHWEWWGGGPGGGPCGSTRDAAVDREVGARGEDAASSANEVGPDGGGEPTGDSANGVERSPIGDAGPVSQPAKADAGGNSGSAIAAEPVPDEVIQSQGGCSCRIGVAASGNRGAFAQAAGLIALLAMALARHRSNA
jgi:hypothetical protein